MKKELIISYEDEASKACFQQAALYTCAYMPPHGRRYICREAKKSAP